MQYRTDIAPQWWVSLIGSYISSRSHLNNLHYKRNFKCTVSSASTTTIHAGVSILPKPMMHFPSVSADFPLFRTFFRVRWKFSQLLPFLEKFLFSSTKKSDDLFKSLNRNFKFPLVSQKLYIYLWFSFPPTFSISPVFVRFMCFWPKVIFASPLFDHDAFT